MNPFGSRPKPNSPETAETFDFLIIGGGATGLGIAVDASSRGYKVALVEAYDFCKGTSSRSTKLIHGGVRYLAQGQLSLVKHALQERGYLFRNAPHLVYKKDFIVPCESYSGMPYYFAGLKFYDILSASYSLGSTHWISPGQLYDRMPELKAQKFKGGIQYTDAVFDDTRLGISLAKTAATHGAFIWNYAEVTGFCMNASGKVTAARVYDKIGKSTVEISARVIVNATGVFTDRLLALQAAENTPFIRPSQGIHLVFDATFFPSQTAMMVPSTSDGRVLFAIPWKNSVLVGTTDTEVTAPVYEPVAAAREVGFILETLTHYWRRSPETADVRSVFAGLRPLIHRTSGATRSVSREHQVITHSSGMISVIGGKWTTYRRMAEDAVNIAIRDARLRPFACKSRTLALADAEVISEENPFHVYGKFASDVARFCADSPERNMQVHPKLPYCWGEFEWTALHECVESPEDIIARRTRCLFIDAYATREILPELFRRFHLWKPNRLTPEMEMEIRKLVEKYGL